jgi:hypothetical protein
MHTNTVSPQLLEIINKVSANNAFDGFRLCGGTALALQIGHRISVDADFITESIEDKDLLLKNILQVFPHATDINTGAFGIFLKVDGIKVDFLSWDIPFIRPAVEEDNIKFLNIEEIAAMKIFAILQRGEKKDYMDIASLLSNYSLKQIIDFYLERHKGSDAALVIRYLSSYSDIENQPAPIMLNGISWLEAKSKLASAILDFVEKN